ncbi:hypothetical protein VPHF99_0028 [Vibrio phage F99]|nr:hypothetical protein MYOV085v1_p0104 [Vibrio phage 355E48.1]
MIEKVYRYRCIFDEKFSAIPYDDWVYCSYEKYLEIKEGIDRGNQYQLQVLCLTHNYMPREGE